MNLYQPEPVEISTCLRKGEWDEESLQMLLESYVERLRDMGAAPGSVESVLKRHEDGSVDVTARWNNPNPDKGVEAA